MVIAASALSTYLLYYDYVSGTGVGSTYTAQQQVHQFIDEYQMKNNASSPNAITTDADGNVWFVLQSTSQLAELIPSNGTVHEFHVPESGKIAPSTWGIVVDNARHYVWFTDGDANCIWRFDMANDSFTKFEVKTPAALPYDIALDSHGNVWFSEIAGKIGEITPSGSLTEISLPVAISVEATGITVDSSNTVWVNFGHLGLTSNDSSFYVASYAGGAFTVYNLTGSVFEPQGIAVDSHGNIWLTQHATSIISEFNPSTGYFRSISTSIPPWDVDNYSLPYFLDVAPDGGVWFTEHYGNAIGHFFPSNNTLVEYVDPSRIPGAGNLAFTLTIGLDPSGQPWFTEWLTGKVGVVNTSAPVDLHLSLSGVQNDSVVITPTESANIQLGVNSASPSGGTILLGAYSGNYTQGPEFNFSRTQGTGNFGSSLRIAENSTATTVPGVYYVTISAETQSLIYSRIIKVLVEAPPSSS